MDNKKSMNRRDFLDIASKIAGGAAIASIPIIGGCKGNPSGPEPPPPPPQPVPVNLEFKVYNHTQGLKASFSKNQVMSATILGFNITDILNQYSIGGVDPKRIALRVDNFGKLIQYSNQGSVSLTVPRQNTIYNIFLFNSGPNDLYQWFEEQPYTGFFATSMGKGKVSVYRQDFDGQTGEERVWGGEAVPEIGGYPGVFDQINQALQPSWASFQYGHYNRVNAAKYSYGFGNSFGNPYWSSEFATTINTNYYHTIPEQIGAGLSAIFEKAMALWSDLYGSSLSKIQTNGVLNDAGKDVWAFMFVRAARAMNV